MLSSKWKFGLKKVDIVLIYLLDFYLEFEEDYFLIYLCLYDILYKIIMFSLIFFIKKKLQRKVCIINYVEVILFMYRIDDFRDRFWMNRYDFEFLVIKLVFYLECGD